MRITKTELNHFRRARDKIEEPREQAAIRGPQNRFFWKPR